MTGSQAAALASYAEAVLAAGRRQNLLARGSLERLGEHLVDSAALLRVVEAGGSVADLGSGAGLPGMVLAVLRPGASVTLVESRERRVAFLRRVVRRLALPNVEVVQARVEELVGRRAFELVCSRALGGIGRTLLPSLGLVGAGGRLVLFKGPRWWEEAEEAAEIARAAGYGIERTVEVPLPGFGRATTFVVFHVKRGGEEAGRKG